MNMKLKVLWICHFSDARIQERIRPWKTMGQFAPWISHTLSTFEDSDDIELHVIAPHEYLSHHREFTENGVHYHFFNPYIPIWGRHWPNFFKWDTWTDYAKNKRIVTRYAKKINPDLIHLQGAENPYYSSTIIPLIGKYPIVVNLQKINLELLEKADPKSNKRVGIERVILQKADNFTIRTKTMERDIRGYRKDAKVYWVNYAMKPLDPIQTDKVYEIVYFARVSKEKGIEDLLEAFKIVSASIPGAKLCVIGGASDAYRQALRAKASQLGVQNQITWKGSLPELDDVHLEASKARVSVLPTHNDIIPGTIIESMQRGLPVVSYKTGSIPELNEEHENLLLVDKGDIHGLAKNIIRLLTDGNLYSTMSQRGIDCIRDRYSNQNVLKQHLDCYRRVIADFKEQER